MRARLARSRVRGDKNWRIAQGRAQAQASVSLRAQCVFGNCCLLVVRGAWKFAGFFGTESMLDLSGSREFIIEFIAYLNAYGFAFSACVIFHNFLINGVERFDRLLLNLCEQ